MVQLVEVNAVVSGLVEVDVVEIDLLYLLVDVPIYLGSPYFEDQTGYLHDVSAHYYHQNHDVVRLQQLTVVPTVSFPRCHQKDQRCREDQEQTKVENVAFTLTELTLGDPSDRQTAWKITYRSKARRKKRSTSKMMTAGVRK